MKVVQFATYYRAAGVILFTIPDTALLLIPTAVIIRICGTKIIYIVHDPVPHESDVDLSSSPLGRWAQGVILNLSHRIVVLTEAGRRALINSNARNSAKILVIPHGAFDFPSALPPPNTNTLLAFGSVRPNKRILDVIRAVTLCRDKGIPVKLIIAGDDNQRSEYLKQCVIATKVAPECFDLRLSYVPDNELPALFAEVDAFVLAYDNFASQSGVAIVAGVVGRPVISSFSGGMGELEDELAGVNLGQHVTAETIADAIETFLSTPSAVWAERAAQSGLRLRQKLHWASVAETFLAVVNELSPFGSRLKTDRAQGPDGACRNI